jgi:amino acid adenylation domain-containing protein
LVNMYGITETTVHVTYQALSATDSKEPAGHMIGTPIRDLQGYILDDYLQPVALGVSGQLHIGGAGLARGYFNRPALTAERFIPHPFSREQGARLYRTGDQVRYLPDGNLEYLGRLDQQVKLRGYRIELGELEAVLGRHEQVRASVVQLREDVAGDQRLVAYVVAAGEELEPGSLRRYMRQQLPEYMVPQAFVLLRELPLTASGKVDRGALPAPGQSREVTAGYVAPRSKVEEVVAGIWQEVLQLERVGVADNFFELGGHSLLATQVIARAQKAFGLEIALRSLFEWPTVRGLGEQIEQLMVAGERVEWLALERVARDGALPLSFAQQRLWFLEQLEPQRATYNIPTAVRLSGSLNLKALEQALSEVMRRHEGLRTTFEMVDGQPAQVIHPAAPARLLLIDLSHLPESEREREARQLVVGEASCPFALAAGPLLRMKVAQLATDEHILLLTMHHIISDGWSMGVLVRELTTLYHCFANELPSPLPELPIQYADYALWQRQRLQGPFLEQQLSYWREQLQGAPALLSLPLDRPRPALHSHRGARHNFALSEELTSGLGELSRSAGATLFMSLLGAFQLLLKRYSGERDVVVGTPIAGRLRRETEGLIGFFVNTLVLRVQIDEERSFRELLGEVKETALGAFGHQEVPFEKLVEELDPVRSMSYAPLFQVMFVFQSALQGVEPAGAAAATWTASMLETESATAKFDLTLSVRETEAGMIGTWEYCSDLFAGESIARMAAHFVKVLEAAVNDPEQPLSRLSLLSAAEEEQLLREFNLTSAPELCAPACLHQLFEAQAVLRPGAIAVVCEQERLTYGELERQANQLAHYLVARGVGAEAVVGIVMSRSAAMVVTVLAVLKAGGAYLAIDAGTPAVRMSWMLADARAQWVITEPLLRARVAAGIAAGGELDQGVELICVAEEQEQIEQQSAQAPAEKVSAENLAYLIYTSGSSGTPKAVMVSHRAICNHLRWRQQRFPLNESDRFLQKASLSFDISVWEIFGTLLAGAQLIVARPGGRQDSAYLVEVIAERQVTGVHFGPAMLKAFLAQPGVENCRQLQNVFCGGEPLTSQVLAQFDQRLEATLHQQYGPTEATVDATLWSSKKGNVPAVVPIGQPIANTQVYLLDERLQPVPLGVSGQLYIGGVSLARGYFKRAALTAERFIPHPFSAEPGARLYRSGDQARYLPDGNLEYLGRLDRQVKLRGYRIELGEIEAVLREQAQVRDTVVLLREDVPGAQRLVAYVVAEGAAELETAGLRRYLQQQLPEYMVPQAFVAVSEWPLTASGKVDRGALPAPGQSRDVTASYVAPRSKVEEVVAGIWQEVLHLERVGVADSFFELGGHSLLATQVIARVRETFQAEELPLRRLFEEPTVEALGRAVGEVVGGMEVAEEIAQTVQELEQYSAAEVAALLALHSVEESNQNE